MKNWLTQYFKDFVHNVIVHPLMCFMPSKYAHILHDKNANWAFGLGRTDELDLEGVKKTENT